MGITAKGKWQGNVKGERAAAAARGEDKYFTGRPCKHGHIDWRYTRNSWCVACSNISSAEIYARVGRADRPKPRRRSVHPPNPGLQRETPPNSIFALAAAVLNKGD